MTALPPFLQECRRLTSEDYFPRYDYLFRENLTHVWREAELATTMNWDAVIESTGNAAAEQLFDYLSRDHLCLPEDKSVYHQLMKDRSRLDYAERKLVMRGCLQLNTIVWLSDKVFICNSRGKFFTCPLQSEERHRQMDSLCWFFGPCNFSFFRIVSRAPTVASVGAEVDIVLQLLSKLKANYYIQWIASNLRLTNDLLPASLQALKAYVSEAQGPRTLMFDVPLSPDQCQVIASHCNKNIHFLFRHNRYFWNLPCLAALIEAMKNNTCPPKITLEDITYMRDSSATSHSLFPEMFHALVAALEVTTSVLQLTLSDSPVHTEVFRAEEGRIQLFGAISRNHVLQELILDLPRFTDSTWEALWSAVAVHPALKRIRLDRWFSAIRSTSSSDDDTNNESNEPRCHEIMVQSLRSNTVLCHLEVVVDGRPHAHRLQAVVQNQILPILVVNRFRRLVRFIKEAPNAQLQELWLTWFLLFYDKTLLHHLSGQKEHSPSVFYLLWKENPDLLVRFLQRN